MCVFIYLLYVRYMRPEGSLAPSPNVSGLHLLPQRVEFSTLEHLLTQVTILSTLKGLV